MRCSKNIRNYKIVVTTHVFATGPAQELEDYLRNKVDTLIFVGHPFSYARDLRSFYKLYKNGELIKKEKAIAWRLPEIFMYLKDMFYTIIWVIASRKFFDLYVGADILNAFTGILLRRLGRTQKVILYTIDYVPNRFGNILFNQLYQRLDAYCLKHCDQVWNLSQVMARERRKRGFVKGDTVPQIVVPIGVHFNRIKRLSIEGINRKHIVYVGHLRKGQGIELVIKSLPKVLEKVSDVKFIIIGTGYLENKLKDMVKKLGLEEWVMFVGFIEDHGKVEEILGRCAVGLAPYEPDPNSFTWYADPSKPKQYLACGLPVIITRVPWIAEEIEKKCMGIVINFIQAEMTDAIVRLIEDNDFYLKCRKNAIDFASKLDWNQIFNQVFSIHMA